jgi:hypothetical protein
VSRFSGTYFFALIVIAVAGFAVYDYLEKQKEDEVKVTADHIFPKLTLEQVKKITYQGSTGEFSYEKEGAKWRAVSPVNDLADESNLQSFIEGMASRTVRSVDVEGGVEWAKYGLAKPEVKIELTLENGETRSVELGTERTFDEGFYIRKNGENKLFAGEREWASDLSRVVNDFRNREIWLYGADTTRFLLRRGAKTLEFIKDEAGKWWQKSGKEVELDQTAVEELVNLVRMLKVDSVAYEDQSAIAKSKAQLLTPAMTIEIDYKESGNVKTWKSYWSAAKNGDVFLYTSEFKPIYKVMDSKLLGLKKELSDLRNKEQPFRFEKDQIEIVNIKRTVDQKPIELIKAENQWQASNTPKDKSFDSAKAVSFVSDLRLLRASKFFNKPQAAPSFANKVELKAKDNKTLFLLEWGGSFKDSGEEYTYVKTNLVKDPFLIRPADLEAINKYEFFTLNTAQPSIPEVGTQKDAQ